MMALIILTSRGSSFIVPSREATPIRSTAHMESDSLVQIPSLAPYKPCDLGQVVKHFCGSISYPQNGMIVPTT